MGWWKIASVESGGISHELPSGHPGDIAKVPCNAVPGRDGPEDAYNGDGPADAMGDALKRIDELFYEAWGRQAYADEMRACFNFVYNSWRKSLPKPPT